MRMTHDRARNRSRVSKSEVASLGDRPILSTQDHFEKADRQVFVKLSYAIQR
jgi:hypothetical protein